MWVWVEEGCESFVNLHECVSEGVYEGIGANDADSSEQIDASELHWFFAEIDCVFVLGECALAGLCGLVPGE